MAKNYGTVFLHCFSSDKDSRAYVTFDNNEDIEYTVEADECVKVPLSIGLHHAEVTIDKGFVFVLAFYKNNRTYPIDIPIRRANEEVHVGIRIGRGVNRIEFMPKTVDSIPNTYVENITTSDQISFCRRCGKKLQEDSSFCPYCGTKI